MLWFSKRKPKVVSLDEAKGYALTIGLNAVDPNSYEGWSGRLNACENDARHLGSYLSEQGYRVTTLLTRSATSLHVLSWLADVANAAKPGDIVVVTNSSHGGQVPDHDGDEPDGYDETIALYDRQVIDDELKLCWERFAAGVRIFFLSDSCHSGTMARAIGSNAALVTLQSGSRAMPADVGSRTYLAHHERYQAIGAAVAKQRTGNVKASVLAFGACQDNQTAMDGQVNGAFTGALLTSLRHYPGYCPGKIIATVRHTLPPSQSPTFVYYGQRSQRFEKAPAFAINLSS